MIRPTGNRLHIPIPLLVVLLVVACGKKEDSFTSGKTFSYFPIEEVQFMEYNLDSIFFSKSGQTNQRDTVSYILREYLIDLETAGDQRCAVIERKIYSVAGDSLAAEQVFIRCRDQKTAWTIDQNLRITHLVFPFSLNRLWDGLSYILTDSIVERVREEPLRTFRNWSFFRISEIDGTQMVGEQTLNEVVTVTQADSDNQLERRLALERYAEGIGLVYRERHILETQNISNMPWRDKAERGYVVIQRLIDFD